jgi:hypothetical protein
VREFPGDAEILKRRKTGSAAEQVLDGHSNCVAYPQDMAELSFRVKANLFCAAMPGRALWAYRRRVSAVFATQSIARGAGLD